MCREGRSASRSLRQWTAPRRRVCHLGKEQYRHKARSYPSAQSTACSELLTALGIDRPEKNISSGDFDKDLTAEQGRGRSETETPNAAAKRRFQNHPVRFVWMNRGLAWISI